MTMGYFIYPIHDRHLGSCHFWVIESDTANIRRETMSNLQTSFNQKEQTVGDL